LWVSDPDFSLNSHERIYFAGSFLYLVEAHWDDLPFKTTHTGCSALQAVVNGIDGLHLTESPVPARYREPLLTGNRNEPFGRGSTNHPIEKLNQINALVSDTKRITTLYRLRYMTDEQCFHASDDRDRFHDILGYPLFISDAERPTDTADEQINFLT